MAEEADARPAQCAGGAGRANPRADARPRALVAGRITGKEGEKFTAGRLGEYTIGKDGEIVLGPLTTFNKDNIDDFDF